MSDVAPALDSLVPPFDEGGADWSDALRRAGGRRHRQPVVAALAASLALATGLAVTPQGHALVAGAFDRLSAWVGKAPGKPAPSEEQRLVREANARSAAPIPEGTELGLLASKEIDGVTFELLGFRDRGSLCLRLRSSSRNGEQIVKAPAECVYEQLLVDLGKPIAVVTAADPFPKHHLVALYGLAADDASAVELTSSRSLHRVPVENNAFLYIYRGEPPRLSNSRLDYQSDVPLRATALDAAGRALGSVRIMSLRRGYPAPPPVQKLPGPVVVERELSSPRVGWLERGDTRGEPFEWRLPNGTTDSVFPHMRMFRPNPATSVRVLVSRISLGLSGRREPTYCLTHLWPLSQRPTGAGCAPSTRVGEILIQAASAVPFDDQFPIYYGLVADGVESLELYLPNGARESVPIVDNVFALQASAAEPAKLVAYDAEHRVVAISVVSV